MLRQYAERVPFTTRTALRRQQSRPMHDNSATTSMQALQSLFTARRFPSVNSRNAFKISDNTRTSLNSGNRVIMRRRLPILDAIFICVYYIFTSGSICRRA